jgi:hypothetical protein
MTALRPPEPVPVPVQIPASPAPAAPDVVKYQVILGLGVIPRVGNFSLPAGGTVRELEIQCRMKWGLEDLDVELVRRNIQTDETFPLNPETLVSSLQLDDDFSLICTERAVEPPPGQPLGGSRARTGTRIVHVADDVNSLKVTHSGALAPGHFELAFRVEQRDMNFKERFAPTATVKDAKIKVAGRLGLPRYDAVTLFFAGKRLQDMWVLNRLRISDKPVVVVLKEDVMEGRHEN